LLTVMLVLSSTLTPRKESLSNQRAKSINIRPKLPEHSITNLNIHDDTIVEFYLFEREEINDVVASTFKAMMMRLI
jgi:hypothetical protein